MRIFLKQLLVSVLLWEARLVVRKYRPRIVAVTGSVGKTGTKDAIFSVLAGNFHVRKSDKSFNSEIGVPLTILGCPNAWNNPLRWLQNIIDGLLLLALPTRYPEWLVLEVGADRPGDISSLASWLPVDVAVITRLPEVPVHVEFFDSPAEVVAEKASLIAALKKDGSLVLYGDDAQTRELAALAQTKGNPVYFFGLQTGDVQGSALSYIYKEAGTEKTPIGITAEIAIGSPLQSIPVSAPLSIVGAVGEPLLLASLAAVAVGSVLGQTLEHMLRVLESQELPLGRMRLLPGIKNTLIIDDTYNASPAAVTAALDTLQALSVSGKKIAVLGDMLELGRYSVEEHRKVGAYVVGKVDLLATVGFRARGIAEAALNNGFPDAAILQYEDAEKAGEEIELLLNPGDCVLLKGSQSIRMERAVEAIMAEPERASELLVRQNQEWKKKR